MTRAAIYTRVSQDRRAGRSVAEQEAACRAVCNSNGWTIVGVFTDNDRSASRHARRPRPDWDRLGEVIDARGCDVLVTWEASRATRDLLAYAELTERCAGAEVTWCYSGTVHDLATREGRLRTGLDALLSADESERTRDRVLRATRANAAAGRPHGRHLYGYRRIYDPDSGQLVDVVADPEQSTVVREAVRRVLAGEPLYAIRSDFLERAVPAPGRGPWDLTQIRRIMLNPAYTGRRTHRGQVIGPAMWPALIEDDEQIALRGILTDPARRSTTRQGQVRHLLSYLARCGRCGAHVVARRNRGRCAYACPHTHTSRAEGAWRGWPDREPGWEGEWDGADDWVTCSVLDRLCKPDALAGLADPDDGGARAAADDLVGLRARLGGFVDAAAAGELSPGALARIEQRLLPQIEAAQRRARPRSVPAAAVDLASGGDPEQLWVELSVAQRREVITAVTEAVEILPTGPGNRRGFDPAFVRIVWRRAE